MSQYSTAAQLIPQVANLLNEDSTPALPEPTGTGTAPTQKSDSDHNPGAGRPSASRLDGPAAPVREGQSPQRPR
jgi:hypothetical protein